MTTCTPDYANRHPELYDRYEDGIETRSLRDRYDGSWFCAQVQHHQDMSGALDGVVADWPVLNTMKALLPESYYTDPKNQQALHQIWSAAMRRIREIDQVCNFLTYVPSLDYKTIDGRVLGPLQMVKPEQLPGYIDSVGRVMMQIPGFQANRI